MDISPAGGALKIHVASDNNWGNVYVGMVGMDEGVESLFIVPWEEEWYYRSIGSVTLKYAVKK